MNVSREPVEADPSGRLSDNIVYFARVLRHAGLPVGPGAVIDAISAVETAGLRRRDDFYWTLHAVFVNKREHHAVFDEAFAMFWRPRGLIEKMLAMMSPVAPSGPREEEKLKAGSQRVTDAMFEDKVPETAQPKPMIEIDARFTMSEREILQAKDFAQMTADELAEAKRLIAEMTLPADAIKTRRLTPAVRGHRFDPRRTLRASLRTGGDLIALRFRRRKVVHPPIVALCDISGSMSQYSRIFLHFLHALTENRRRVSSFLFGTRLTDVSRQLRVKDPDEALAECSAAVVDWSGGTRIASALHEFNRRWGRRVLGQGATVLLITDGLERDSDADLAFEMDRLHRSCRRLIWLNPLLRFDEFEAKAWGIRTMLPHVDVLRPVHSLDAMRDLVAALDGRRDGNTDPKRFLGERFAA
ncbi:MAG: VWA domain-containing protein [Hyphomicrobiales bacterium]|nr:VWA domain-containing protein [Hyphomicrobiales bacterium]